MRSVDGVDFHGFSFRYNETGENTNHRFHYEYGLMDCSHTYIKQSNHIRFN